MAFSSIGISFASGSNQEPQNNNNNNNTCSVIGLPIPERSETPVQPSFFVPFARDPDFVECGSLLDQIRERCAAPASRVAVVGSAGVGKTHLAIEYCYRTRGQFRWVFWVHALGCARFEQGYRDIADHVKIPRRQDSQVNVVKLVNDWLSDCKERWLLVLDSVEDAGPFRDNLGNDQGQPAHGPKTASRPMRMSLPYCDRGSILITTRSKNVALECVKLRDIISVGPMDEVQARALVENKLGVQERGDASVDELTAMLDYSPLAMVHSTAYISKRAPRCSVAKYIEEFKSAPKRSSPRIYEIDGHISNSWKKDSLDIQMLSSERAGTDAAVGANSNGRQVQRKRKTAIASTWQLSFEYMQSTRPSAAGLLAMMSFFDGREIPEALIRRLSKHKNAQGSQNSYGNHDFDSDKEDDVSQCGADYDAFDDDVLTLLKYNFISVRTGGTSFVMHRLVQSATRTWLDESDRVEPQRQQRISNLCAELLQGQYGNWEACQALLEHVRSVAKVDMRAPKRPPMPLLGRNSFSNADDALMADDERKVFFDARPSKEPVQYGAWMHGYRNFCSRIASHSKSQSVNFPVKVAIIDTGIDVTNPFIGSKWPPLGSMEEDEEVIGQATLNELRERKIQEFYKDFLEEPSAPNDNEGHGTHIAGIILRHAPCAHLYVARVADTTASCNKDPAFGRRVVSAIRYALETWKVDIISLSFAIHESESKPDIDSLLKQAYASKKETIIFAAACNEGGNQPVPYPANNHSVFSIRALTTYGKDAQFNPNPTTYEPNFAMLGTNVLSTWPTRLGTSDTSNTNDMAGAQKRKIGGIECMTKYMDGTSFATPLAAALVANVLAFHNEHGRKNMPKSCQIQNYECVRKILLQMSEDNRGLLAIMPWKKGNIFCMSNEWTIEDLIAALRFSLRS